MHFKSKKGKNMKKTLLLAALACCALAACQSSREEPVVCPSCNPPARHFEIVTECSDYKEKDLGNGAYSQCRFCSSRIYSDGIDVTDEYDDIESVVIGYFIKEKRMDLRMSQQQLAEKIGIDQSDLSKIEKGNANPSIKTLKKIAKGLNCKLSLELH